MCGVVYSKQDKRPQTTAPRLTTGKCCRHIGYFDVNIQRPEDGEYQINEKLRHLLFMMCQILAFMIA